MTGTLRLTDFEDIAVQATSHHHVLSALLEGAPPTDDPRMEALIRGVDLVRQDLERLGGCVSEGT